MHRHKRKFITQGLSDDVLRQFEPALLSHVCLFVEKLATDPDPIRGGWTAPKNVADFCIYILENTYPK